MQGHTRCGGEEAVPFVSSPIPFPTRPAFWQGKYKKSGWKVEKQARCMMQVLRRACLADPVCEATDAGCIPPIATTTARDLYSKLVSECPIHYFWVFDCRL